MCEEERKYVLQSWNIFDIEESPEKTTLYYTGNRLTFSGQADSPITLEMRKNGDDWQIVKYTCFY
ncbi:MAG: hypothetical protein JSS81_06175 [Acidobacteria bacterium]|nr:hypothetical protein [Acidobacteriota bacterium]